MKIVVKRIYETPGDNDGIRVLVDRLWPRGLTKVQARVDYWIRDAAPSTDLRRWFAHDPAKWSEFKRRYFAELSVKKPVIEAIRKDASRGTVTILFAAKETQFNHAVALKQYLIRPQPDSRGVRR